ncbi:MAG: Rpn family recombination-promoting nuclease/putative transposase [Candidatus Symbiothrix sp.]|jgi:predicted transposase/invertase (TIGR01784 family)|nr:Rpn family recombination-promoting nuclease/putative transposase [Candidatus Symbiothrix sp.]
MKKVNPKRKNRRLGTFMNFLTDFAFKKIFKNKKLLTDFLNEILGEKCKMVGLDYLDIEQLGRTEEDRKAVYDIYCKNEDEKCFIIEMQVAYQKHYLDRMLFYSTFPIQDYAIKGNWNYELKPLYCISIVNFGIFKDKDEGLSHLEVIKRETMRKATGKLNYITIELPKFKKTPRQLETRLDCWIYCIKHLWRLKKQPAELHDEIFDDLFETARINKLKEEDMGQYKKSITDYKDVQICMRDTMELGMEKGMRKGLEKGILKIVKNSLKEGLSIDILSRITELSPEQIKQMQ